MKKIPILILVITMILNLCFIPAMASSGDIRVIGTDAVNASSLPSNEPGHVQLWTGHAAGYELDLKYPATEMELTFNTGAGYRGALSVRLGSPSGETIARVDTTQLTGEWTNVKPILTFSKPIQGKVTLYICCEAVCHWIVGFTLNQVDPNAPVRHYVSLDGDNVFSDIADDNNTNLINLLSDMGVITDDTASFMPQAPVTRLEFVSMVARIINAEGLYNGNMPFADIDADSPEAKMLGGLYELGIIRGDIYGNFNPNRIITYTEAATVCTNALGYGFLGSIKADAFSLAKSIKLFRGVETSKPYLTKTDSAALVFNLITGNYLLPNAVKNDEVLYKPEANFLEKNTSYYYGEGIVDANFDTTLYAPGDESNFVTIDGDKFFAGTTKADAYLGVMCSYFYTEENGKKTLRAIRPSDSTDITVINTDINTGIDKFTDKELIYSDNDDEYDFDFSTHTAFIYNGVAIDSSITTLVNPKTFTGTVTIIDNAGDKTYDCVRIDSAKTVVVDGVREDSINNKLANNPIDIKEKTLEIFENGKKIKLNSLVAGDVLTVYESANQTGTMLTRIIKSTKVITGIVEEISGDKITISGGVYEKDILCNDEIYPGLTADFYLNEYDKIVRYTKSGDIKETGVFLGLSHKGTGLNHDLKLKILTQQGIKIYDVNENIIADGVNIKNVDDLYNGKDAFAGLSNVDLETPILFRLNSIGYLCMIDTVNPGNGNKDDTLTKLSDSLNAYGAFNVLIDTSTWSQARPYSKDVKFITITSDKKEENYSIASGFPHISDTNPIGVTPYSTKADSFVADILYANNYAPKEDTTWRKPFIYKNSSRIINAEEEEAICVNGYGFDSEVQYEIDMDYYNRDNTMRDIISSVQPGDILWPKVINNKVVKFELSYLYDGENSNSLGLIPTMKEPDYSTPPDKYGPGMHRGTVNAIEDGFIEVLPDSTASSGGTGYSYNTLSNLVVATVSKDSSGRLEVNYGLPASSIFEGDKVFLYGANYTVYGAFIFENNQ